MNQGGSARGTTAHALVFNEAFLGPAVDHRSVALAVVALDELATGSAHAELGIDNVPMLVPGNYGLTEETPISFHRAGNQEVVTRGGLHPESGETRHNRCNVANNSHLVCQR